MKEDDAVGVGFGGEEFEADGAVARLNQGDAFADEDGDDVDAELVDFALVQKGGDDFAAAFIQICLPGWARRRWANELLRAAMFASGCSRNRHSILCSRVVPFRTDCWPHFWFN